MAKGFKHGGGGSDLNFRVLSGTAAPASPKENDIWVNTDAEITGWHFGTEDISGQVDLTNSVNATNVVSGLSNGEIHFKNDLPPMWSSTYIAKIRLFAGVKYVIAANLGYGRFSLTRSPEDSPDGMFDFVEGLSCGQILNFAKNRNELTPLVTADYYVKFCSDHTGANGAKPAFSTGILLYPKSVNVWFQTGATSPVPFNALKKNGLMVYPLKASQYINGAWVEKTAKSYQGGAWVDWTVYLFNDGDQCTGLTGGWAEFSKPSNTTVTIGNILAVKSDQKGNTARLSTVGAVDLSDAKTLWITSPGASSGRYAGTVHLCTSKDTSSSVASVTLGDSSAYKSGKYSIDVSGLNGSYYIFMTATANQYGAGYADASEIWIE